MTLKNISSMDAFRQSLSEAGPNGLILIDFFATWCGPCKVIAPIFQRLAEEFPHVTFCKCDVDKARDVAQFHSVSAMPTFKLLKGGREVAQIQGADANGLRRILQQHAGVASVSGSSSGFSPYGLTLMPHIDKPNLSCLNEADGHGLRDLLGDGYLQSDADEQLIVTIPFKQAVKIRALKFRTESSSLANAPKAVKLFANNPNIGFDDASTSTAEQTFELSEAQTKGEEAVETRYVKFQKVHSLSIFVESNQGGEDETRIDGLELFGDPGEAINSMASMRQKDEEDE